MKKHSLFLLLLLSISINAICQSADTTQKIVANRTNSADQQKKPYVILISADGFRYDFAKRYNAENIVRLGSEGVTASSMIPSYPSVTFPNHYAIVSGLYPSHSGLVNNTFYDAARKDKYSMSNKAKVTDGTWYGGSPLWVLAEQQKMLAASFYWIASESAIKNVRPTYYYNYNEQINIHDRITAVADWLKLPAAERPHLITFYLPQVDHAAHLNGPESPEVEKEVHFVDSAVNELQKAVKATGLKNVNFIFLSDHGMTRVDNKNPIGIPTAIDTAKFIVSGDGVLVELYAKDKKYIQSTYDALKKDANGYAVYLKTNVPTHLHYGTADDRYNRIGDILLIPYAPKVFNLYNKSLNPGWHGYDPSVVKDMHASFFAWGPAFKKHLNIPAFENVSVFNLVSRILGLKHTEKVDGTNQLADKILLKKTPKKK